jgi:glutamyl-tRNA reductase
VSDARLDSFYCWSLSALEGDDVAVRELATLPTEGLEAQLSEWARVLRAEQESAGLLYLGTCHRVEFYAFGGDPELLRTCWRELRGSSFEPRLVRGEEALRRLARVTASLESEVVGETQITGQVRSAAERDRALGALRGPLDRAVQFALRCGKRVRTHTRLGEGTVSVAHVAVDGLSDVFESLEGKSALVIGAGSMAEQALQRLRRNGIRRITWVNRTRSRLEANPLAVDCNLADFAQVHELAWQHSVVVAATGSPEPILKRSQLGACSQLAKPAVPGPRVILDLGLPRNADERIHGFGQFYVRNVDEFSTRIRENSERRRRELARASELLEEEVQEFLRDFEFRSKGAKIGELYQAVEALRQADLGENELEKNSKIDYLSRNFSARLLHRLVEEIESLDDPASQQVLDVLLRAWRQTEQWPERHPKLKQPNPAPAPKALLSPRKR